MTKHPTVLDVARLAHVGASTVSRFLRGVPVRRKAGERIANAVKDLGYIPDQTARALRAGRSHTIGILLPKVSNVFFSEATQLVEEEARKQGCSVILLTHQDRIAQQQEHLLTLRRYRADGVILVATPGTLLADVRQALPDVPLVALDSYLSPEVDSVVLRNREAARMATEHLLSHGYRSIFCVGAKPKVFSFSERMAGYAEAIAAADLTPHFIVPEDYEHLHYQLGTSLRGKLPPDAVLSLSDFATLHTLTTFNEFGLTREERLPLIGFDDFGYAQLMDPPLTVIRQPIETMTRYALSALFRRIEQDGAGEVQEISLPGELIRRRSCGCV
jgi:LacI family transcriptional regulator